MKTPTVVLINHKWTIYVVSAVLAILVLSAFITISSPFTYLESLAWVVGVVVFFFAAWGALVLIAMILWTVGVYAIKYLDAVLCHFFPKHRKDYVARVDG